MSGLGQELADDLDSRQLELDVLTGGGTLEDCTTLEERFGAEHPLITRVRRCQAMVLLHDGRATDARSMLETDLAGKLSGGYERAMSLRALIVVLGRDSASETAPLEAEASSILAELGVTRAPPLGECDLAVDSASVVSSLRS